MSLFKGRTTVTRANKISDFTVATVKSLILFALVTVVLPLNKLIFLLLSFY